MWKPEQHSDDENLRWALLRAIEWKQWPVFLSQPIIPILLYFYPWWWIVAFLMVINFTWWLTVVPKYTPSTIIDLSVYFVKLRFAASPLMAYFIWQNDRPWTAALALLWPFAGTWFVLTVLALPQGLLDHTARAKAAQIGVIQRRLMSRFGYVRLGREETTDT